MRLTEPLLSHVFFGLASFIDVLGWDGILLSVGFSHVGCVGSFDRQQNHRIDLIVVDTLLSAS
jgi:hypothetical protein